LLGDKTTTHCTSNLGVEQEFFVIDRGFYLARPDLVSCGRSLIGAQPPKGQQMEDHYFGSLDRRILAFMQDVEWRLWKLGVPSTTRHNEVAPSQYEIAPVFEQISVACDHNMLTMEVLKETAKDHHFACLLHEKPFAGVNGSGKHNNWSISTNTGDNLIEPGNTPKDNVRFILMLAAVVRSISLHGDLLRVSIATPGNDFRLGMNEAPPAIISIFTGEQLEGVIDDLISDTSGKLVRQPSKMQLGVNSLPTLPRDASDRNRTSPFAFTGNKFEFRAVGSSQSCARPATFVNAIVADSLNFIADELERLTANNMKLDIAVQMVVSTILKEHKRCVFNGNGYSEEWRKEAATRGLPNLRTTPEGINALSAEKNIALLEKLGVLTKREIHSTQHIMFETYSKTVAIEAECLSSMVSSYIVPAAFEYKRNLIASVDPKEPLQAKALDIVNKGISALLQNIEELNKVKETARNMSEEKLFEQATFYRNDVMDVMAKTRAASDALEVVVDDKLWPFPKYSELLFLK